MHGHTIMYLIIALVIIGAITHPAGSTALLGTGTRGAIGIGSLLTGNAATGGAKGSATTTGAYTFA